MNLIYKRWMRKLTPSGLAKQAVLLLMTASTLFPVYFMLVSAFKLKIEYVSNRLGLPIRPVLSNFVEAFKGGAMQVWFLNSLLLTLASVSISLLFACLAAFAFSHMKFRGKDLLFNTILSLMVIPPVVMIIPLFTLMTRLHLVNTYYAVILVYVGLQLPFSIYLLRNFYLSIHPAILDAARVDGATDFQILWLVILPLSRPALVTLALVNSLWVWNELLIALVFLQPEKMKTMIVGLTVLQGRFQINQPMIMAGMLIAALPMSLLYVLGQRYFVSGLTAGSVKGE